ncbi:hypothetical protein RI129_012476 [Pyrocoelia pectoralis]|uniref:CRAL-TRIO domain-containing protein n=1 Tax=Pyrocoelia pectoralis TaxID=417401 RepID=A0AAN7ZEY4_9COLE
MKGVTAETEYDKNPKLRKEDVMMLKEWTEKQLHLPEVPELHLIFFLHSCYYSIEKAKATINAFFTYRAHCPEFFKNRDPTSPALRAHFDVAEFLHLPKKTPDGNQIVLFRYIDTEIKKFDLSEQIKIFDMSVVQWMMENGTPEGVVILCDLKGLSLAHIMKANLLSIKKACMYVQDALFIRLKSIHFINVGQYMDVLMNLVKPFMKNELINSIHFHSQTMKNMYKYIPIECLPKDYGGLQPSLQEIHDANLQRLTNFADYYQNEDSYIADESKRVGKPTNANDLFGVEGSFKKLDID